MFVVYENDDRIVEEAVECLVSANYYHSRNKSQPQAHCLNCGTH